MTDDHDECEWVNVSSGTTLPGLSGQNPLVCVCVCVKSHQELSDHPNHFIFSDSAF